MNKVQKIIKYVAIALAIFLVFNIVSGIVLGVAVVSNLFSDDEVISERLKEITVSKSPLVLDIETSNVNIMIKEGNTFKVETNHKNVTTKEYNDKLIIKEKDYNWFGKMSTGDLIIYVPTTLIFNEVLIESGAGKVTIKSLTTKKLDLDLGAGKVDIENLNVESQTEIDGGAGEIIIDNSIFHNLDLDQGAGKLFLTAKLVGNSEINSGVGEVNLSLLGLKEEYRIKIDKGIGTAKIDGEDVKNNTYYGEGSSFVDIDGGIGSIQISFQS